MACLHLSPLPQIAQPIVEEPAIGPTVDRASVLEGTIPDRRVIGSAPDLGIFTRRDAPAGIVDCNRPRPLAGKPTTQSKTFCDLPVQKLTPKTKSSRGVWTRSTASGEPTPQ